jgi:hypothetical protein
VIEFSELSGKNDLRPIVLNVDAIDTFEPAGEERTKIVLRNGHAILAALPYAELRRIVLEARSQFVTVL